MRKLLFSLSLLALAPACADPCVQLTDIVCECKANEPERAQCAEQVRVSRAGKDTITEEESLACEALLDKCTCDALAQGDLAACGLTP